MKFEAPVFEIVMFANEDVILTSGSNFDNETGEL